MSPRASQVIVALLLLSAGTAAERAGSQSPGDAQRPTPSERRPGPPLIIESLVGQDLFRFYCASCHGADAKGRGPVAGVLKSPPADLTSIAARSGGEFPRSRLIAFVSTGEPAVTAHGSPDMPVWGPIFGGLDPSAARTRVRIENLVSYIESLQQK